MNSTPFLQARGVALVTRDIARRDWPTRAEEAGLTTIATHIHPRKTVDFLATEPGRRFPQQCGGLGLITSKPVLSRGVHPTP